MREDARELYDAVLEKPLRQHIELLDCLAGLYPSDGVALPNRRPKPHTPPAVPRRRRCRQQRPRGAA